MNSAGRFVRQGIGTTQTEICCENAMAIPFLGVLANKHGRNKLLKM